MSECFWCINIGFDEDTLKEICLVTGNEIKNSRIETCKDYKINYTRF